MIGIGSLIATGLSVLPKVPAIWSGVARIFGKEPPQGVATAAALVDEIQGVIESGRMTPEQRIQLETVMLQHDREILSARMRHEREMEQLVVSDLQDVRGLEQAAYQSGDEYIARTRPKILREMWGFIKLFCVYAPLTIIAGHAVDLSEKLLEELISMTLWIGGWLFATFGTAYLGYAAARTVDKRSPEAKAQPGMAGRFLRSALGGK